MSAPYHITGVVIPKSTTPDQPHRPPPQRRDIVELKEKHKYEFTLFILSWLKIMEPGFKPASASFQEIAGIHGMPYVPWLGDPDEARQAVRGPYLGYCNHGSILFPTWHRPHLLLLEQSISDVAYGIAGEFASVSHSQDEANQWMKAAEELRLPFWDWTHHRTGEIGIPEFITKPKILLYMPNGDEETHKNPLYSYRFTEAVDGFTNRFLRNRIYNQPGRAYFKQWDRTYRNPNSQPSNVTENINQVNARLESTRRTWNVKDQVLEWEAGSWRQLTTVVSQMFTFPVNIEQNLWANAWDEFSNTARQSAFNPKNNEIETRWHAASLEQPHNTIHVTVGGIGHMSDNDTAGFDPIFYLHHCNVDRLLAFWQHVYPDYVAGIDGYLCKDNKTRKAFTQASGTWILKDEQPVDEDTPLLPFRNGNYQHWTSKDTYSLKYADANSSSAVSNKYYTYPPIIVEVRGKKIPVEINTDPAKSTPLWVRKIHRRYLQNHFGYNPIKARESAPKILQPLFSSINPYAGEDVSVSLQEPIDNFRQFVVSVSLDPRLVEESHSLVMWFRLQSQESGIPDPQVIVSSSEDYEIGEVTVLSRGRSDICANCQAQRATGVRVHGVVLVPHQLVAVALNNAGRDTQNTSTEDVVTLVESCLQASLRLSSGETYGSLTTETADDTKYIPNAQAPHTQLLSCDVYHQLEEKHAQATFSEKLEIFEELPFDFRDWKAHGPLTDITVGDTMPQSGGPQSGRIKRSWVLGG